MSKQFDEDEPRARLFRAPSSRLSDDPEGVMLIRTRPGTREAVVACRVDPADLEAIDMLVEAGLRSSRSEAAAWLIRQGAQAQRPLLEQVRDTVAQIRKLREDAKGRVGKLITDE